MVVYSLHLLDTRVACDAVLGPAYRLQAQLTNRDTNLDFGNTEDEARAQIARAELIGVTAELGAASSVLAALPAGASAKRTQYEIKQAQLEARQRTLQGRGGDTAATLDNELDAARNEADLAVVNDYIAQIEAHKATLAA